MVRTLLPQAVEEEEAAAAETTTSPEAAAFVGGGAAAPAGVWETCAPESNYHPKQNTSAFIFYTLLCPYGVPLGWFPLLLLLLAAAAFNIAATLVLSTPPPPPPPTPTQPLAPTSDCD